MLAPLVAVATVMIGLRVGAGDAVRAAIVFGAPPAAPSPEGKRTLAWQLLTVLEDRGVRESLRVESIEVVARTASGAEAKWAGATNADGIAEVILVFDAWKGDAGDPLDLEVWARGDPNPLARGRAIWSDVPWGLAHGHAPGRDSDPAVRPTKRIGSIPIDVVIEQQRLVTGFPSSVWVRAVSPEGRKSPRLTFAPEPGLVVERESSPCANVWTNVRITAQAHVVGLEVRADNGEGDTGEWFGALPVAAGAFFADVPRQVSEPAASIRLVAPNPRTLVYAEVDDAEGRAFAVALPMTSGGSQGAPETTFRTPALAPGLHWLVVSGEPRGAEHLSGAAMATPFVVGGPPAEASLGAAGPCALGPWLASRSAVAFPRWVALDGLPLRSEGNRRRHRRGLLVALVALAAAGVLELLLLSASAREARIALQLAELEEDGVPADKVTASPPGGGVAVALLVAVLGFALLAALLIAKA